MHELNDHWHGESVPHEHMPDTIRGLEVVNLTTIGIDIGSSTSHLMISEVELQRSAHRLSSRFVVVSREVRYFSEILLTPFTPDGLIDTDILSDFITDCYKKAGIETLDIDTGAVILTGEALKRHNARAIADLFAQEGGKFVCASAGHLLEARMAANGSGVLPLSKEQGKTILNIDIGGGTTKFALARNGTVLETAAIGVGGRLLAWDENRILTRIEEEGQILADEVGVKVELGGHIDAAASDAIASRLAQVLANELFYHQPDALVTALRLTPPLSGENVPEALSFSGGVSEYIYGREMKHYGDLAPTLAEEIRRLAEEAGFDQILEPKHGIRATVTGASQFAFQVSGNTVLVSDSATLPYHNLPVIRLILDLSGTIDPELVSTALVTAAERNGVEVAPIRAVGLSWEGAPTYSRMADLAHGLICYLATGEEPATGIVLLFDADIGRAFGNMLVNELGYTGEVICLDGLEVGDFDYVDIGAMLEPSKVVPVVIKSLVF